MPIISFQQAVALAFGAYMSPNGNKSFSISESSGLPTDKNRLSGLLSNTPIDLVPIPAEAADSPFNPLSATFNLATTQSIINEATGGVGGGSNVIAETGNFDQLSSGSTRFLLIKASETVSGNLTALDTEPVYVSSSSPASYSAEPLPAASNITVSKAEGPYNIAKLSKTAGGTIQIDILRAKGGDAQFWSTANMQSNLLTDGLEISITGSLTSTGFNTTGNPPNKPEFELVRIKSYPLTGVNPFSEDDFYFIGEYVEYLGDYYVCIDNTSSAHELPVNLDFWEKVDTTETDGFFNIQGLGISFSDASLGGGAIQVFRINIPVNHYARLVLNTNGRYTENANWMPVWISLAANTTVLDADTGGGTAGNQCGTLLIKPTNSIYAKGSAWILELSQPTPANNAISINGGPQLTSTIFNNTNIIFTIVTSGGALVPRLSYLNGGDINSSNTLTQTERNYHNTGVKIVSKLKK